MPNAKSREEIQQEDPLQQLLRVEDLIHLAMGPVEQNIVNFKIVQTVLFILARQMRLLEQKVELRTLELHYEPGTEPEPVPEKKKKEKGKKGEAGGGGGGAGTDAAAAPADALSVGGVSAGGASVGGRSLIAPGGGGKKGGKGAGTGGKGAPEKTQSGASMAVSERAVGKDKVRDVDKGGRGSPSGAPGRKGSIEVVTVKEFAVLEAAVKALQEKSGLPPPPKLPDNKKLRSDIAKGSASLTDTMHAMQLASRVQSAETAIEKMADLLTQLASMGILPQDIAAKAADIQSDVQAIKKDMEAQAQAIADGKGAGPGAGKSRVGGPSVSQTLGAVSGGPGGKPALGAISGGPGGGPLILTGPGGVTHGVASGPGPEGYEDPNSVAYKAALSTAPLSYGARMANVTYGDLEHSLALLREDVLKNIATMTTKPAVTAEKAASNVRNILEQIDTAIKLDQRVGNLQEVVNDYSEQLNNFDTGLSTQMGVFQDQMLQLQLELQSGLGQLEQVNNNAETAAILELTERYEGLVRDLDNTLHAHQSLTSFQRTLTDELKALAEAVEMMREQKADRDEVEDGLRDKADMSRLDGLLTEKEFAEAREELELKMQMCYEKFRRQDNQWMNVMNDFSQVIEQKAELTQLMGVREDTQDELQDLHRKVQQLARLMGDPKAALVTRKLAKDATCGVCRVPALMEPTEPTMVPKLPFARQPPAGAPQLVEDDICLTSFQLKDLVGDVLPRPEAHMCQRWVGGSHTLIGNKPGRGAVLREQAEDTLGPLRPVKRFLGEGIDGKLYKLEADMIPCEQCNQFTPEKIPGEVEIPPVGDGSGDQEPRSRRVTVVDPDSAQKTTVVNTDELADRMSTGGHRGSESSRRQSENTSRRQSEHSHKSDEDNDFFPKLSTREQRQSQGASFVEREIAARDVGVGKSVQGRVSVLDEDTARQNIVRQQIQEGKAKEAAAEAEGEQAEEPDDA